MAKLLDEYAAIAPWDVSTRQTNEGFIRRTIKPALGHLEVRKVRGPILDQLYARLKRCGHLTCTGRPFTEHHNIPVLTIGPRDPRPAWQQVTEALRDAIRTGTLAPGDELPSITELDALQYIGTGVMRHALEMLAADGLILVRRGQTAIVAGNAVTTPLSARGSVSRKADRKVWSPDRLTLAPLHERHSPDRGGAGEGAQALVGGGSHSRPVPSSLAAASRRPSGLNAISMTVIVPACPYPVQPALRHSWLSSHYTASARLTPGQGETTPWPWLLRRSRVLVSALAALNAFS